MSLSHAWKGIRWLILTQANARLHLAATLLVVMAGIALGLNRYEWTLLALAIALVWVAEALNTAIECLADALHPEHDPLVGRAKDVAAGGVLLSSIAALIIAVLILIQRFS